MSQTKILRACGVLNETTSRFTFIKFENKYTKEEMYYIIYCSTFDVNRTKLVLLLLIEYWVKA